MGCNVSHVVNKSVLHRMDTETLLSLPDQFQSTPTLIRQEDTVDQLSTHPASASSVRDVFPCPSRPGSPLPSIDNWFEDQLFPANDTSICSASSDGESDVMWLRPHEFCATPRLFVDGVSRCDVKQGNLGDCWLLSACAAVATRQDNLERVVRPSQPLYGPDYTGLLVFKFWRFGEWIEICIDDRLPNKDKKLIFASCTHPDEFWLPLLEKAFAKIHGSYMALEGGQAGAALADLTGGIAERISTCHCTFEQLELILQHGAFVTCSRSGDDGSNEGKGLIQDHAYTITSVTKLRLLKGSTACLLRLRSPWADHVEWNGAWADRSDEWECVIEEDRHNRVASDDGEFWISYRDFQARFQEITVATLGPDFDQDGVPDSHRQQEAIRGVWEGETAGGSRNDLERFQTNPQYLINFQTSRQNGANSVLMGLMQLPRANTKLLPIAFFIYKSENGSERLRAEDFLCLQEEARSGPFTDSWEVVIRCLLPAGDYVIIPATFYPECQTEFLLRIYALTAFTIKPLV